MDPRGRALLVLLLASSLAGCFGTPAAQGPGSAAAHAPPGRPGFDLVATPAEIGPGESARVVARLVNGGDDPFHYRDNGCEAFALFIDFGDSAYALPDPVVGEVPCEPTPRDRALAPGESVTRDTAWNATVPDSNGRWLRVPAGSYLVHALAPESPSRATEGGVRISVR